MEPTSTLSRALLPTLLLAIAALSAPAQELADKRSSQAPDFLTVPNVDPNQINLRPRLAADAEGNVVAIWQWVELAGAPQEIRAALFDAQGRGTAQGPSSGSPFTVSGPGGDRLGFPEVARSPAGPFVVVWVRGIDEPTPLFLLEGRRFSARGRPTGPIFQVNSDTSFPVQDLAVAMDSDGRFAVAWTEVTPGIPEPRLLLQRFGAGGARLAGTEVIASPANSSVSNPALAFGRDGSLLEVWRRFDVPSLQTHVMARLLTPDGTTAGEPVQVDQGTDRFGVSPSVSTGLDGSFLVVWDRCAGINLGCKVEARRLSPEGQPLGEQLELAATAQGVTSSVQAALEPGGGFAAVWSESAPTSGGPDIHVQRFDGAGEPVGEARIVDVFDSLVSPAIAPVRNGFAVAWEEVGDGPDGVFGEVVASPAAADPCAGGDPAVLCLRDGRFAVSARFRVRPGQTGMGTALPLTSHTGAFWFFREGNAELLVKVLDGRAVNGHWWVFTGALSNVEHTLTVTDTASGRTRVYFNPQGRLTSRADTTAFDDPSSLAETATESSRRASGNNGCGTDGPALCLLDRRFEVEIAWRAPGGRSGLAVPTALSSESGTFTFFNSENIELLVKVLDGRAVNGHFWLFYASLSNLEYTVTVRDMVSGAVRTYSNPAGRLASVADTLAF